MEAMRAVGYSAETAIADLLDNSISAHAQQIHIQYDGIGDPYIAIFDDGDGMTSPELTAAMRHGSRNPLDQRQAHDLGRFGLGLKTASLSQCRKLTVVSKKDGVVSGRRWDLDIVEKTGKWLVVVPSLSELQAIPMYGRLENAPTGTIVVWQELDRLSAGAADIEKELTQKLSTLREHLALVFHRFLEGDSSSRGLVISVNGLLLPKRDPFLRSNKFIQPLEGQCIKHPRGDVQVLPFVLPPVGRLSADEIETAGGGDGLRSTQGFYIYRNRRLVVWGTWFKIVPKDEFYKLTRVQVDIPNSFDDLWSLDIKKSTAQPPEFIRNRLRELLPHFSNASRKTITFPGRKATGSSVLSLWVRYEASKERFDYRVNSEHPLISDLASELSSSQVRKLQTLTELFGHALPLEAIYADMCGDRRSKADKVEIEQLADLVRRVMEVSGMPLNKIIEMEPFCRFPELFEMLKGGEKNV